MRIVLLRHGKPDVPDFGKLQAKDFKTWIESYNEAGLAADDSPHVDAITVSRDCNCVVCSDLPRSLASARALGVGEAIITEPVFREMGLPYCSFPSPRLPANAWAAIFRLLWFSGFSRNCETFSEARRRAACGAQELIAIAEKHQSVLLVGHGLLNRFIARELLANGWHGPATPAKNYWDFGVYENVSCK